ncbi:hypothetical protein Emag_006899 [Eimeria magna]
MPSLWRDVSRKTAEKVARHADAANGGDGSLVRGAAMNEVAEKKLCCSSCRRPPAEISATEAAAFSSLLQQLQQDIKALII